MKKGIIFDLDQTLVDSNIAKSYRSARNWNTVYSLIRKFVLYEAYDKVFEFIRDNDLKVGIVSKAPSAYVKKVLNHFNIPFDTVVAYHDVKLQKPNSEGMNLALTQLGLSAEDVISFGDEVSDVIASNGAGIESVACLWGSTNEEALLGSEADHVICTPNEIISLLK